MHSYVCVSVPQISVHVSVCAVETKDPHRMVCTFAGARTCILPCQRRLRWCPAYRSEICMTLPISQPASRGIPAPLVLHVRADARTSTAPVSPSYLCGINRTTQNNSLMCKFGRLASDWAFNPNDFFICTL